METHVCSTSTANDRVAAVGRAVELLRKGEIVALPTETVYGLAADALDPIAVAKIFEAKGRPHFDHSSSICRIRIGSRKLLSRRRKIDK